jgi:hypothetical protein
MKKTKPSLLNKFAKYFHKNAVNMNYIEKQALNNAFKKSVRYEKSVKVKTLSEARDSQHKLFKEVFHIYSSGDPFEDTQESVIDRILAEGYSISLNKT